MSNVLELYQAVVLNHGRAPRGFKRILNPTHSAEGFNPICGDKIEVSLAVLDNQISDIGFAAQSCALCRASASVMVETVTSKPIEMVSKFVKCFHSSLRGEAWDYGGDAAVFAALKDYPARVKCVYLPWKTLEVAVRQTTLGQQSEKKSRPVVSTESDQEGV